MKKAMFLLATLLIGGLMLTGCKKPEPTPDPEPTPTTTNVAYRVTNTHAGSVLSPCFKLNVTYLDANGHEVTETGVEIPWSKTIEVTTPFHAKMVGEVVYNEEDIPDPVTYGACYAIVPADGGDIPFFYNGGFSTASRENFLLYIESHPNKLKFTQEEDF